MNECEMFESSGVSEDVTMRLFLEPRHGEFI
jgi:hypothetical protein